MKLMNINPNNPLDAISPPPGREKALFCCNKPSRLKYGISIWLAALMALLATGMASAGMQLDIEKELRLLRDGQAQQYIDKARYRFAVFTFEDPDGTGLGNAMASILSHELLMNSKVSSVGVLRYVGNLSKASEDKQLRYFDKVEPLIESQGVQVAVWGTIRRSGDRLRIDSFTQLSPSTMRTAFSFSFRMPLKMGGGRLVHRVGPDRMLAQRLELPAAQAGNLAAIAANLDRLRAAPKDNSPIAGQLPLGSVYYLKQRRGEWVEVSMLSGKSGWLRSKGFCTGPCEPLLSVSRFASELMAYDDIGTIPQRSEMLAPDAKIFVDQLFAVSVLNGVPAQFAEQETLHILKPWCPAKDEAMPAAPASPPGGAAICNLRAITRLVSLSRMAAKQPLQDGRQTESTVRSVVDELATVSMSDPRHVPTLQNLATLFDFLGDTERAALARKLATDAGPADQAPPDDAPPPWDRPKL